MRDRIVLRADSNSTPSTRSKQVVHTNVATDENMACNERGDVELRRGCAQYRAVIFQEAPTQTNGDRKRHSKCDTNTSRRTHLCDRGSPVRNVTPPVVSRCTVDRRVLLTSLYVCLTNDTNNTIEDIIAIRSLPYLLCENHDFALRLLAAASIDFAVGIDRK